MMGKGVNRVVVASDSFKGSLSSLQVAEAVCRGVGDVCPEAEVVCVNVADGGEGTLEAVASAADVMMVDVTVCNPLGRQVEARYGLLDGGRTAVVEMAQASGLTLLSSDEMNPMITSTYGTGEMIADALKRGCRKIYVGIGGSATNDGGMGMLAALGYGFHDVDGHLVRPCGETLEKVAWIDSENVIPELSGVEFIVACDVENPLYGPLGAAHVFAPQKGADERMVDRLDSGMRNFASVVHGFAGRDVSGVPGAGAAGGLGWAFMAFLGARLMRGVDMVLDIVRFDEIIDGADLLITGEGCIDSQTAYGKVPSGVLERAKRKGIPVVAIGGSVRMCPEIEALGFDAVVAVTPENMSLEEAMDPSAASANIEDSVRRIL